MFLLENVTSLMMNEFRTLKLQLLNLFSLSKVQCFISIVKKPVSNFNIFQKTSAIIDVYILCAF